MLKNCPALTPRTIDAGELRLSRTESPMMGSTEMTVALNSLELSEPGLTGQSAPNGIFLSHCGAIIRISNPYRSNGSPEMVGQCKAHSTSSSRRQPYGQCLSR